MPAAERIDDLALRKRLLLAEADLHRRIIELEQSRLRDRYRSARGFLDRNRWWLLGGTVAGSLLAARKGRGLVSWLPILAAVWRARRR